MTAARPARPRLGERAVRRPAGCFDAVADRRGPGLLRRQRRRLDRRAVACRGVASPIRCCRSAMSSTRSPPGTLFGELIGPARGRGDRPDPGRRLRGVPQDEHRAPGRRRSCRSRGRLSTKPRSAAWARCWPPAGSPRDRKSPSSRPSCRSCSADRPVRAFANGTATLEIALRVAGIGPGRRGHHHADHLGRHGQRDRRRRGDARCSSTSIRRTRNLDLQAVEDGHHAADAGPHAGLPRRPAGRHGSRSTPSPRRHGLRVIEDAAQAIGSRWNERLIGSFGDLVSFSFQANKNITCAEGGCLVLNSNDEARARGAAAPAGRGAQRPRRHGRRRAGRQVQPHRHQRGDRPADSCSGCDEVTRRRAELGERATSRSPRHEAASRPGHRAAAADPRARARSPTGTCSRCAAGERACAAVAPR